MSKRGPEPKFSKVHICLAVDLFRNYPRLGRKTLAEKLGLGEGSVRTVLGQLRKRGLIKSARGGHSLTERGKKFLKNLPPLVEVKAKDLTLGRCDVATVVRRAAGFVGSGVELRDEAIKSGATGATVLIFRRGELQFPDGFKVEREISEVLRDRLRLEDGDVVIIGTGADKLSAKLGAMAAAQRLGRLAPDR